MNQETNILMLPLTSLVPNSWNPNFMKDDAYDRLVKEIKNS